MELTNREQMKYEDPNEGDRGILLSNQIDAFCRENLLVSKEYKKENLRPASYTLRIGDPYIDTDGHKRTLSDQEDTILFKKNSIIFVSTKEELDLPYYIIARFNLRVNWVYEGILLGTGPQVDPGFLGVLSCPLYNLTNGDILIRRGQDFATIDFEKTTTLLKQLGTVEEKRKLIEEAIDKRLVQNGGETHSFYKLPPFEPLQHRRHHNVISSLLEMREELRTWRGLGIGSLIAFFGLTLSLLAFGANLYRQNSELSKQLVEGRNELLQTKERISKMEADFGRLSGPDAQTPSPAPVVQKERKKNPH